MQAFVLIYFLFSTSGRFFIWLVLFSTTVSNISFSTTRQAWFYFPLPIIELISTHYYFSAMFSTTTWESDFIFHYQDQPCFPLLVLFSTTDFIFHYQFCNRLEPVIFSTTAWEILFSTSIFDILELVLTGSNFHYWFYFPLLVLFSTTGSVFVYSFCFILPLTGNPIESIQPIFRPVVKRYFLNSGNILPKI